MTVLRVDAAHGTIIHTDLWPVPEGSADLTLNIQGDLVTPTGIAGLPNILLEAGSRPRGIHITSGGRDLCAHPAQRMTFLRDRREGRFEFLLVDEEALAVLRDLLAGGWMDGEDEIVILAGQDFILDTGREQIDVRTAMPRRAGTPDRVRLGEPARVIARTGPRRNLLNLTRRPAWRQPPMAESLEEWRDADEGQWPLQGDEEILRLPLAVSDADTAWFYDRPFMRADHLTGRVRGHPRLMHERAKFVMMARHAEGVIFDEDGVCNEFGYLHALSHVQGALLAPPGMRCDHSRRLIDRQALALAPRLEGAYAVFTPATLGNYTHWLMDGLLVLHILAPFLPETTRLLLPATLRDLAAGGGGMRCHHETLRAFGFARLPSIEIAAPYCRVDEVYWLDDCHIGNMPAQHLRTLRARALSGRKPPAAADGRIHIGRRVGRRVVNAPLFEAFLAEQGFTTYYTEDLSIDEQIDIFAQAAWVIAPHGAGLGNLLFCPPGTKIIDIMPDIHFQPYFSYMCNKLGLAYSVLPCPTHDGGVNGDIIVDMRRLRALFRMMKNRL